MYDLPLYLIGATGIMGGLVLAVYCIQNFESAIFLVAISPFISVIFLINGPNGENGFGPVIGSYLRISLLLLMGFVAFVSVYKAKPHWSECLPSHLLLLLVYILIAIASVSYSIDKKYTLIRSFSFLSIFIFLVGLHTFLKNQFTLDRVMRILFTALAFFTLANLLSFVILPDKAWSWEMQNRFQGVWGHPNSLGSLCMISYPIFMWKHSISQGRKRHIIMGLILACAVMHVLSGSRGTLFASAIGVSVWFIVLKEYIKFLSFMILISMALLSVIVVKPSRFERQANSNVTQLTGRTDMWEAAGILIMENPVLGYGYGVGGKVLGDPRFSNRGYGYWSGSARASLHQGYLTIAIGLGIAAFAIWLSSILIPVLKCSKLPPSLNKAVILSTLIGCMVLNLAETAITGGNGITAIFFWIIWVIGGKLPRLCHAGNGCRTVSVTSPLML